MTPGISSETQAILLLTAPLIAGRKGATNDELLTPGEYRRIAGELHKLGRSPSDLLGSDAAEIARELDAVIPAERTCRLLDRGFLLSQALERWQARAIWILSPGDAEYPQKLKSRLQEDSPTILYGCGQPQLLEAGGLAVVGSRHVDELLIDYTEAVGRQCAEAGKTVVSGGAQGIDRAAMRGALEAGGRVTGVLADGLEPAALNRDSREWLLDGKLVLISPYDPGAGFNVGHAMQRNKAIYALADAALAVSADYEKGGTWAGAAEQLKKFHFVPVYVRSTGEMGPGLQALAKMGAQPWPNPQTSDELLAVFDRPPSSPEEQQPQLGFDSAGEVGNVNSGLTETKESGADFPDIDKNNDSDRQEREDMHVTSEEQPKRQPAETLFGCVREILLDLLATSKTESEVAAALQVSKPQAKLWLQRLVEEGSLEKRGKPVRFLLKQERLL
jgi:predicted Rossmann fold nucleotide-binding protein DprA/Smf involved in DNA uptake